MNEWRELKTMMKALADMVRLTIVYYLVHHEEITVTALTDLLGISQPLVSWHLRKLRRADLITTRRVGRLVDPASSVETLPAGAALIAAEMSLED
jgi:ArsR family transcriptional regulator